MLTLVMPRDTLGDYVSEFQPKLVEWTQLVRSENIYDLIDKIKIFRIELVKTQ